MGTKVYDNYEDLITFNRNSKGTALRPIGYGDELVTNGTFDTDSDWDKGTGWTISGGQLSHTAGTATNSTQTISFTLGKVYKATCDVISVSGGSGSLQFRNGGTTTAITINSSNVGGTVELLYVGEGNNQIAVGAGSGTNITVDNISVKEVLFDREGDPLTLFNHPEGVPRIEYDADGNLKGLLIEPEATNIDTASSSLAGWYAARIIISTDQTTAPDGVAASADEVLETATTGTHYILEDYNVGAGSYIFSCFVKSIGGRNIQLATEGIGGGGSGSQYTRFNLSTGTVVSGTGTITKIGDGWYRVSGPAVTAGATGIRIIANSIDGTSGSFLGDVTKGFYMWGMQVELGPIATSYMPTTGSPFTRGKDEASMTNVSGLIGQTEGTLYLEVDARNVSGVSQDILYISNNNFTNRIYITLGTGGELRAEGNGILISGGGSSGIIKIALGYADNNSNLFANGSQAGTTDTTCTISSGKTDIDIGQSYAASNQANMWIRAVQIIPRRLSNEQLIELTS